jgi:Domain of unknown function (DUF4340)
MRLGRLAWTALLLASLAAGTLVLDWYGRNEEGPDLIGHTLIGTSRLAAAGIVLIETPAGQVTLRRTPWGWSVDEAHGFSADTAAIRALLLRYAGITIAQKMRVRPERLADLGLLQKIENDWRFAPGRTASVLSVIHDLAHRHRLIYQVLIGNPRAGGGTYVRYPDSRTVYVVDADLVLDGRAQDWIDRRVFAPEDGGALRRIRVQPEGAPALTFTRSAGGRPWHLLGARTAPDAARLRTLTETLEDLRIVDVSARGGGMRPPPGAPWVELRFADGRAVRLTFGPPPLAEGDGRRATLAARLVRRNATDDAAFRAGAFNWRFEERVVALDAAQSRRLLAGRQTYLAEK